MSDGFVQLKFDCFNIDLLVAGRSDCWWSATMYSDRLL